MTDWALSKNEGSTALAIGLLGLAKLNRSNENFDFLLSIALLRQTKSTIARVNRAIDFLAIKNDKKAIHYWPIGQTNHSPTFAHGSCANTKFTRILRQLLTFMSLTLSVTDT